jgi:thiosulfate/3-mercaptopyruvate sulfurtransferase
MHRDLEDRTMKTGLFVWFSAMLICVPTIAAADKGGATANTPDVSILVKTSQLQKKLNDKNIRILDVRSQNEYAKGHIPGALRVDVGDWKNLATADNGLHDAKSWAAKLAPLAITSKTHVVVYGGRLTDTARIWWLLKYLGVKNASLLNGSWDSWAKLNRPAQTSTPRVVETEFKPVFQADRLEEIDSLKKTLKSDKFKFVDTRSDSEFAGGRIPGAAHLEWKELVAKDGRFKTKAQLQQLFRGRGIMPDETAVCY